MPPVRTDQTGGYPVAPVEHDADPGGDFRLLDIRDVYQRLMLEDDAALDQAAAGWQALGQRFFGGASALRSGSTALADAWQSDAATALADRVTAAATSFDAWGYVAVDRAHEVSDLATALRTGKSRLQQLWAEFHHATGELLTPPPDLTAEQRQEWRSQVADAPALEVTIRTYTQQVLDEVVNPLANRFSEAALSFTVTGPVYAGPTNAAVPSGAALLALTNGSWLPDGAAAPPVPAIPGAPTTRSVPAVPAAPAPSRAPGVPLPPSPTAAVVGPASVRGTAPVPQPAGVRALRLPPPPGLVAPGSVTPAVVGPGLGTARMLPPGVSGVGGSASLPGRQAGPVGRGTGLPAAPSPGHRPGPSDASAVGPTSGAQAPLGLPRAPGAPGTRAGAGAPGSPLGTAPPPVPRLPGRTGAPDTSANPPPHGPRRPLGTSPHLEGRTNRTALTEPPRDGTPGGGTPGGPQLPGRGTAGRPADAFPPPPGARRAPDRQPRSGSGVRAQHTAGAGWLTPDPAVPPSLRSGRRTPSRYEDGRPTAPAQGRHAAPVPAADPPAEPTVGRHRPDAQAAPPHPGQGRRLGAADPAPTPAGQRAADRARRRAEWDAARREHQHPLTS